MTELERLIEAATQLVTATTDEEYAHAYAELCDELGHDRHPHRYHLGEIL